ncbi:MAG: ABC transporter ATP-binding protein, partial [Firmicutes bacterium]|nr:ABC transporter ATP-binding protein [Bacillota bacterium]
NDVVVVAGSVAEIIPSLLGTAARLVGALSLIIYFIKQVAWIIIPAAIVIGFLTFFLRKRLKAMHKRIQESDGRLRVFLTERLSSLMIVRSFAMEEESLAQAEDRMDDHYRKRMARVHFLNICNIGFNLLIHGMYVAAVVYCGHGILVGNINYGTFAAVVNLVGQLKAPIAGISGYIPRWYSMLASAERLMEAERFEDDIKGEKKSREEIPAFYRECFEGISLKNAAFSYIRSGASPEDAAKNVVLDGISFDIDKHQIVAVTGPSGCGKSTLLKLLMCFYPLDGGERLLRTAGCEMVQGTEGSEGSNALPLDSSWRGLFAYVPQGNQLMSGTIRDVLTFGDGTVPEDAVSSALDIACASEFVSDLPKGLDTELGERGSGLSEGQIQRLAIARAVLSGHPLLLLDEATSSLDEATEEALLRKLRTLTDRTVVIVTHRLKVLSICDTEIHMDENGTTVRRLNNG